MRAAGEVLVVVDEELGVGAGVAVDHLVVVADAEHVVRGRGDEPQHEELRGREVLELVDEQVPALGLRGAAHVRLAQQHFDRAVDLLVVVDGAVGLQLLAVLVEHRAEPGDIVASRLDELRVDEAEADLAERLEVRRVHVGVGARLHGHERLDAPAHLPLVDQGPVPRAWRNTSLPSACSVRTRLRAPRGTDRRGGRASCPWRARCTRRR